MRRQACLFAVAFFVYNLNLRPIPSGDTAPAALLPLSVVSGHSITLDRFAEWYRGPQHMNAVWFTRAADGHYYSSFPIALPLLIAPLYAPLAALDIQHMPIGRVVLLARVIEKISASLIAALSVVAFLALARKLVDSKSAWMLTIAYAFGSPTWSISSQALWQHGAGELAFILALLLLMREGEHPAHVLLAALAGWCAGFGVAIRLSNAFPCILMTAYAGLSQWRLRSKAAFACGAFLPVAAVLIYNVRIFGSALGAYPAGWLLRGNLLDGIAGLLISPSRGLLVFCPVFLFSAIGVYRWFRTSQKPHAPIYLICLVVVAAHFLTLARYRLWWGGFSYGPRLITDVIPCLVILMIPAMRLVEASGPWKSAFGATLVFSIFVQAVGAFCYPNGHWDSLPRSVDQYPERLWDWRDNQIVRSASAGPVLAPYRLGWICLTHPESLDAALKQQDVTLW
ncbi:MAG TPA: hypothetical protein VK335_25990 [Bryobacteraceae bacterium]|nr:hypothetical protein [Bryobacteraceae bacterium]